MGNEMKISVLIGDEHVNLTTKNEFSTLGKNMAKNGIHAYGGKFDTIVRVCYIIHFKGRIIQSNLQSGEVALPVLYCVYLRVPSDEARQGLCLSPV